MLCVCTMHIYAAYAWILCVFCLLCVHCVCGMWVYYAHVCAICIGSMDDVCMEASLKSDLQAVDHRPGFPSV